MSKDNSVIDQISWGEEMSEDIATESDSPPMPTKESPKPSGERKQPEGKHPVSEKLLN
jgi:hypothetical protein